MMKVDFNSADAARSFNFRTILPILPKTVIVLLITMISIPLWPLYWLGCLIWNRPPNTPRTSQVIRYLKLTWTVDPPFPGISFLMRIGLTLSVVQRAVMTPIVGLAWLMDEILYGKSLDKILVTRPVFVISAARSGSTQLTRYLEDDPRLVAPNILQCMFPFMWLWRLVPRTIGRFITHEKVVKFFQTTMPAELWERHEADPFRADTFDGSFYSSHLHQFSFLLGPEIIVEDFNFAKIAPHDQPIKEVDFIDFVDRIARKAILHAGSDPAGIQRQFFIKGHFLYAAQSLREYYPDARFITLIREPLARIRSGVNYMRVNPPDPVQGPIPWAWLGAALEQTEVDYCELEQKWFTQDSNSQRCVIRFTEFTADLETTMKRVYLCCFDSDHLPPHVPENHPERERKNYSVNRTLSEVGINESGLKDRLAPYIAWCQGDGK